MRAVPLDQAVTTLLVAKQHEVFAEQLNGPDRARSLQLIDQRGGLPVHPHQFPASILWPGAGHQIVLFLAHHGGGPSGSATRSNRHETSALHQRCREMKLLASRFEASGIQSAIRR
jgi:hypothetical protein